MFGGPPPNQNPFGGGSTSTPVTTTSPAFGPLRFGTNATASGVPQPGAFGGPGAFGSSATASGVSSNNPFLGKPGGKSNAAMAQPVFGSSGSTSTLATTAQNVPQFGQPAATSFSATAPAASVSTGIFGRHSGMMTATGPGAVGQPGGSTPTFGQPSGGTTSSQTRMAGPFGTGAATGSDTNPVFGKTTTSAGSVPTFGKPSTTVPNTSTSVFGQPAGSTATTTAPVFGQTSGGSAAFGQLPAISQVSAFGHSATVSASAPAFGKGAVVSTAAPTFGQAAVRYTSAVRYTGAPAFGQTAVPAHSFDQAAVVTSSNAFGPATTFGSTAPVFGQSSTGTKVPSVFGQQPASTTNTSVFGQQPAPSANTCVFGQHPAPAANTSVFGQQPAPAANTSVFGQQPAPAANTSVFGQQAAPAPKTSVFGQQAAPASKTSVFGQRSDAANAPAASTSATSVFGQVPVARDSKSAFAGSTDQPPTTTANLLFGKVVKETTVAKNLQGAFMEARGDSREQSSDVAQEGSRRSRSLSPSDRDSAFDRDDSKERKRKLVRRPKDNTRTLFGAAVSNLSSAVQRDKPADLPPESRRATEAKPSSSKPASRDLKRSPSVKSDITSKVAIVCKNIPAPCFNKAFLRKHFSRYGKITRLVVNANRNHATIHFDSHEAAADAKKKGRGMKKGFPLAQIFWGAYQQKDEGAGVTSPESESSSSARRRAAPRTATRSDLDDELASMGGTADVQREYVRFLDRPEEKRLAKDERVHAAPGDSRRQQRDLTPPPQPRPKRDVSPQKSKVKSVVQSVAPSKPSPLPKSGVNYISLKSLCNTVAQSNSERCEILENRDKLIRQALGSTKHADLATAQAVRGTCPDMCPERERYVREDRRRLSHYEIIPGTDVGRQNPHADHARCIKEYSRSSADQEMPLPLELRPPAVLKATMDYIMNNILDLGGEGKWADWYEFVWSRTRGIRKDITQQHLCDLIAVDLTEKCVRFHVYCAERLCEEDMMSFDEKINNENMTKCLQTLREFYHDMDVKQHVVCPREAEFRAYLVLMNLNEGDGLREVLQLRRDLRESPEVRFAVEVYWALNSNNFVKFFRMVRTAPFLLACVMHRYFTQVRSRALLMMGKAYRRPGTTLYYPLSELTRKLLFEDDQEAADFCEHHGLMVQDGSVLIEQTMRYVQPETAFPSRRARRVVESKQSGSVGEVVNGGPLPENIIQQPSSSFDDKGRFTVEHIVIAPDDADSDVMDHVVPVEVPPQVAARGQDEADAAADDVSSKWKPIPEVDVAPSSEAQAQQAGDETPEVPKVTFTNEMVKDVAKELFVEVIDEFSRGMADSLVRSIGIYLQSSVTIYGALEQDVLTQEIPRLSLEALEECESERRELEARGRAERAALRAAASSHVADTLIDEVVHRQAVFVAREQYSEVQQELRQDSCQRVSGDVAAQILNDGLLAVLEDVAEEVFQSDVTDRLQTLDRCERAAQLVYAKRFLRRWQSRLAGRQRLKRSMLAFPAAPSIEPIGRQMARLLPESLGITDNCLHLGMTAYAKLDSVDSVLRQQDELRHDIRLTTYRRQQMLKEAWAPFNLSGAIYPQLRKAKGLRRAKVRSRFLQASERSLSWKLVISLPECSTCPPDPTEERNKLYCDWLTAKFRKGTVPNPDQSGKSHVISLYSAPVEGDAMRLCVRTLKGTLSEDEINAFTQKRHLLGTSAVMFYVGDIDDEDELMSTRHRLDCLMDLVPCGQPLPLVVLREAHTDLADLADNLQFLVENEQLTEYTVVDLPEPNHPATALKLLGGVRWACERCPPAPDLATQTLRDYVEDFLGREFHTPLYQDAQIRKKRGLPEQSPGALVTLYNSVVEHLAETAGDRDLSEVSWPIPEFSAEADQPASDWNTEDQLEFVGDRLMAMLLPECSPGVGGQEEDEEAGGRQDDARVVLDYVSRVADEEANNTALYGRVRWLLMRRQKSRAKEGALSPQGEPLLWTDVILACVEHRLTCADWFNPHEEDDPEELKVHYLRKVLASFKPPSGWTEASLDSTTTATPSVSVLAPSSGKRKFTDGSTPDTPHDRKLARQAEEFATPSPPTACAAPRGSLSQCDLDPDREFDLSISAGRLDDLVANERRQSALFEERLRKALAEELPNLIPSPPAARATKSTGSDIIGSTISSVRAPDARGRSLEDDLGQLLSDIESEKQAGAMLERQLQFYLQS